MLRHGSEHKVRNDNAEASRETSIQAYCVNNDRDRIHSAFTYQRLQICALLSAPVAGNIHCIKDITGRRKQGTVQALRTQHAR